MIQLILEKGANLIMSNRRPEYNGYEVPALSHAILGQSHFLTMLLLEMGADVMAREEGGRTHSIAWLRSLVLGRLSSEGS